MLKFKNIAVCISGGVDSAVAAILLKNKGYNIQGVFMQNWDIKDEKGVCTGENDYQDALYICNKLNIPLHHVNFVKEYWNEVFLDLLKDYQSGYTPNPDIVCNKSIKFKHFYKYAMNHFNVDAIATGHYARTNFGSYLENYNSLTGARLLLAKDRRKDQTFFLSQIEQESLHKTMFPVGNLIKSEVKHIAYMAGFKRIAEKHESMGICFIGSRDFQNFIEEYVSDNPGNFVDVDTGEVIGKHSGLHKWTLGQRIKIGGLAMAYFTARKDIENNIIYVAQGTNHPILYSDIFSTSKPHWIYSCPQELNNGGILKCNFKFQHTQIWTPCRLYKTENGLIVYLEHSKRAITPGQYAVFSKGEECLGSAKILNCGVSNFSSSYLKTNQMEKNIIM